MAETLEFTTAKRSADPIEFTLDGEEYTYIPQKTAGLALALTGGDNVDIMRNMFNWLSDGLPQEQADKIIARLKDPKDDLDVEQLGEYIEKLQEKIAGRPPTSAAGSKRSQTKTGRTSTAGAPAKA